MADALVLRGGTVLTDAGWQADCVVRLVGGRIDAVGTGLAVGDDASIDARSLRIIPGFVDIHVHGAGGAMFEEGREENVAHISAVLARYGTTAIAATLAALPPDRLRTAVETIARAAPRCPGARIAAIHLEGPFLNPQQAGAQQAAWMRPPSIAEVDALQAVAGGMIRLVTIAPELPEAAAFVAALRARGIAVALGHSAASEAEVLRCVEAGAMHVTHLFNAAAPLHHRSPGLIGTALTDDRLSVDLICDGEHLHRRAVDIAVRCKAPDKVILISDGVAAIGMPAGPLDLFGLPCIAGDAVRVQATGQLAGSNLTLDRALRTVRDWFPNLPLEHLLGWVTATPATLLGIVEHPRRLTVGCAADLVLLTERFEVAATICGGRIVYRR